MTQEIFIVDAFTTDQPFSGNPAGVCIVDRFPADSLMQSIATEMNQSETAFAEKIGDKHYNLRWFTPTCEVNLCGHATVAATHVLHATGALNTGDQVAYETQSGTLFATVGEHAITLDFPNLPGTQCPAHPAFAGLGVAILHCERNRDNYLVEVADMATLLACTPDMAALKTIDMQGVIVTTATGTAPHDFASRYFVPKCGIDEDPVTGSAHCFLAPYWADKLGKPSLRARQASTRGGDLDVTLAGDRVQISGTAMTRLKGELILSVTNTLKNQGEAA